jgi:hypothetical protein
MNAYEAKQEAKRERLLNAAERAQQQAQAAYKRADLREEVSGIPFGQPILVGHHSEGRHRAAIKRADNAMRASIDLDKKAGELAARAAAVGTGGISSDDPEAIQKLQREVGEAQALQDFMRSANKLVRAAIKLGVKSPEDEGFAPFLAQLQAIRPDFRASGALALLKPDFCGRVGFADFQLTNNGANIKRMEKRIAQLKAAHAAAEAAGGENKRTVYQGLCEVIENFEENRLQLLFEGKPDAAIRDELKSYGFRWAPSQGAWQRQLNNGARYAVTRFLRSQGIEA